MAASLALTEVVKGQSREEGGADGSILRVAGNSESGKEGFHSVHLRTAGASGNPVD